MAEERSLEERQATETLLLYLLKRYLDDKLGNELGIQSGVLRHAGAIQIGHGEASEPSSRGADKIVSSGELLKEIRHVRDRVNDAEHRLVTATRNLEERVTNIEADNLRVIQILSESDALSTERFHRYFPASIYVKASDLTKTFEDGRVKHIEPAHYIEATAADSIHRALSRIFTILEWEIAKEYNAEFGSWFQRFIARTQKELSRPEVQDRLGKLERALEIQKIDGAQAHVDLDLSKAAGELSKALQGVDIGIISIGSLFVVKRNENGQTKLAIISLTQDQMKLVKANPAMQTDPDIFFKLLNLMNSNTDNQISIDVSPDQSSSATLRRVSSPRRAVPRLRRSGNPDDSRKA
jgi:hypothetical protein